MVCPLVVVSYLSTPLRQSRSRTVHIENGAYRHSNCAIMYVEEVQREIPGEISALDPEIEEYDDNNDATYEGNGDSSESRITRLVKERLLNELHVAKPIAETHGSSPATFVCSNPRCRVPDKRFTRKDVRDRHVQRCMEETLPPTVQGVMVGSRCKSGLSDMDSGYRSATDLSLPAETGDEDSRRLSGDSIEYNVSDIPFLMCSPSLSEPFTAQPSPDIQRSSPEKSQGRKPLSKTTQQSPAFDPPFQFVVASHPDQFKHEFTVRQVRSNVNHRHSRPHSEITKQNPETAKATNVYRQKYQTRKDVLADGESLLHTIQQKQGRLGFMATEQHACDDSALLKSETQQFDRSSGLERTQTQPDYALPKLDQLIEGWETKLHSEPKERDERSYDEISTYSSLSVASSKRSGQNRAAQQTFEEHKTKHGRDREVQSAAHTEPYEKSDTSPSSELSRKRFLPINRRRSSDAHSRDSTVDETTSVDNWKLLASVEDAIKRLILPELTTMKKERQKLQSFENAPCGATSETAESTMESKLPHEEYETESLSVNTLDENGENGDAHSTTQERPFFLQPSTSSDTDKISNTHPGTYQQRPIHRLAATSSPQNSAPQYATGSKALEEINDPLLDTAGKHLIQHGTRQDPSRSSLDLSDESIGDEEDSQFPLTRMEDEHAVRDVESEQGSPKPSDAIDEISCNGVIIETALRSALDVVKGLILQKVLGSASLEATDTPGGSGPASGSRSASSISKSRQGSGSRNNNNIKRARGGGGSDPGDEDDDLGEDEDDDDRSKKKSPFNRIPQRRLKCPFYQRDPEKYTENACSGKGFTEMAKLKDHLKRVHMQPLRCPRCYIEAHSNEQLLEHLSRDDKCTKRTPPHDERISPQILNVLNFKKSPFTNARTAEEKWKMMYRILFPVDSEADTPSPYNRNALSPGLAQALSEALEEELALELEPVLLPIVNRIRERIPAIIARCRTKLAHQVASENDETISVSSAAQSSSGINNPSEQVRLRKKKKSSSLSQCVENTFNLAPLPEARLHEQKGKQPSYFLTHRMTPSGSSTESGPKSTTSASTSTDRIFDTEFLQNSDPSTFTGGIDNWNTYKSALFASPSGCNSAMLNSGFALPPDGFGTQDPSLRPFYNDPRLYGGSTSLDLEFYGYALGTQEDLLGGECMPAQAPDGEFTSGDFNFPRYAD
ncbi:hypothetical protein BU23DRAFT_596186 [Bimuria novae-zelandiae CBS 107.79]|uniref:C2H2-type domain-containing protein n=1 Tax=Bimuria novae-zelandiae CBS 107.79 TaxID=1447943 RepID=A0A6A5VSM3_9PLEO|nr:hypothetical protein BU23DRAFT_596186 [Bimuria novae-zelandiae CBS 107.79]